MENKKNENVPNVPKVVYLISWYYIVWSIFILVFIPGLTISMKKFSNTSTIKGVWIFGFIPLICVAIFSIIAAKKLIQGNIWSRKALIFIASLSL